jgi:hypothetical protein
MSSWLRVRPPAMISSVTGRPAASNASMTTLVPNAVASSSARYISGGRVASVRPTMAPER